jgi:hypothetical protein
VCRGAYLFLPICFCFCLFVFCLFVFAPAGARNKSLMAGTTGLGVLGIQVPLSYLTPAEEQPNNYLTPAGEQPNNYLTPAGEQPSRNAQASAELLIIGSPRVR